MTGMTTRLLLLSNSATHGRPYLSHALDALAAHLAGRARVLFVPYALVDHDDYTATVAKALLPLGLEVTGLHTYANLRAEIEMADAIFIGGGNTFRLLRRLRASGLLDSVRRRVRDGIPYVGSSAGTNVACPTIKTTNDMPIVDPHGFDALGLVPFQINPHYLDPDPQSTHQGETRAQRLTEFCDENEAPVVAMREGAWLVVEGLHARLGGSNGGLIFRPGEEPAEITPGADLSWLLSDGAPNVAP